VRRRRKARIREGGGTSAQALKVQEAEEVEIGGGNAISMELAKGCTGIAEHRIKNFEVVRCVEGRG
jgi:hypothetical protein